MKKYRFLLYQKALLAIIAILLPIAVTFYLGYSKNKEHAIKDALADLIFIADTSENVVYYFLELHKRRVEDFASDGFIRDRLEKIVNGHDLEVNSLNNHLSQNKKPLDNSIHDISVISLKGKIVSSTDPSSIGSDVSAEPFFLKGKTASSVTENGHGFTDGHKLVTSTPVKHRVTGDPLGVLANFIPFSELSDALSGDFSRKMGAISWGSGDKRTTDVYLVNRDRFMIADSGFIEDALLKQIVDTEPVTSCIQSKHEMNGFYKDYRGVEVAGASMCFPSMGWTLLVEQDKDKILLPLVEIRNDALLTSAIVTLFISILFIMFNRAIVGPIKRLSSATNDILRGNYDIKVVPESGDEIGQLSEVFNEMAYEIKAKTNAFRDSEKKLIEAQRVGNIGSWEWDLVNNKLSWHFETYRILGVDLSKFGATFDAFLEHVHPDDRDSIKEAVNQAIDRKEKFSIDHRVIHPGGSVKMVHQEAKIMFDETGQAISMIGMVQDITERKQSEEKLKKSRAQLHDLALHLQDVREDERKRIARDIHDDLGQILSVFNLELMGIKNSLEVDQKSLSENIEEVMKMADNAIDTVQRISSDLRPALLDDLGLFAALEWQTEEFEKRTGIKCELTVEPWNTILSKNITVAIFRIFQEALTNILRHAEATKVYISLKRSVNILTLEVIDNGKGITENEISKSDSLGLLGIRERISPWDGKLHIIGTAGKGTKLTLSVPLGKEGEEL